MKKTQFDRQLMKPLETFRLNQRSLVAFWVLVTEKRPLTGLEIADCLGIKPHNIARTLKPLQQRKLVRSGKIPGRPSKTRYFVPPIEYVEQLYVSSARNEFRTLFQEAYRQH
jgi:DNA-binding transcriptional regulator GbsR (MarR family)